MSRLDSKHLETLKREFYANLATNFVSRAGTYVYQVSQGRDTKEPLNMLYLSLHNLRHLTYSIGMRKFGNYINNFESYVKYLKDSHDTIGKLKDIIIIHQSWNVLTQNLNVLSQDPYAELNFNIEGINIMDKLKSFAYIPKVRKMNIIALDDDKDFLNALENVLGSDKFSIQTYTNPDEVFEAIKSKNLDCLVCDINMPQMNGFEILEKARSIDARLKICMLSSEINPSDTKLMRISTKANLLLDKNEDLTRINSLLRILLAQLL